MENRPQRILIVEDSADTAEMLRVVLERRGHEVAVAHHGHEALELLREADRTDVVLCDIGLPDIDGYEVARAIRADPALADVALVALTGYGQPKDRRRTSEAGFDAHLVKPVGLESLDALLARLGSGGS